MKLILRIALLMTLNFVVLTKLFAVNVGVVIKNADCAANGNIQVNVTGATPPIYFQLIYPDGSKTPIQASNLFDNLPGGIYEINVYDALSGSSILASTSVMVPTNYVNFNLNSPYVGKEYGVVCRDNGRIEFFVSGGRQPYRFKISGPDGYVKDTITTQSLLSVVNLKTGTYSIEAWDACGSRKTNDQILVESDVEKLANVVLTSVDVDLSITNNQFTFEKNCKDLRFNNNQSGITVYDQNNVPIDITFGFSMRFEYPLGTFNEWASVNPIHGTYNKLLDYDSTNLDYRIYIMLDCDSSVIVTSVNKLPPVSGLIGFSTSAYSGRVYSNFSNYRDTAYVELLPEFTYLPRQISLTCWTSKITATPRNGGVAIVSNEWSGNRFDLKSKDWIPGETYDITMEVLSHPMGVWHNTVTIPKSDDLGIANRVSSNQQCDLNRTKLEVFIKIPGYSSKFDDNFLDTVTYRVLSGPEILPTKSSSTKFMPSVSSRVEWESVLYGEYEFEVSFSSGRPSIREIIRVEQKLFSFREENLSFEPLATCGRYRIRAKGSYLDKNGQPASTSEYYHIRVLSGPPGTLNKFSWAYSANEAIINDLPGGTYVIGFSSGFYNLSEKCIFSKHNLSTPVYTEPTLNIPLSGGISCTNGLTTLTVSATGTHPPLQFRAKKENETDDKYSAWQSSNVFIDQAHGNYTVQILDDCGSITTQNLKIFNSVDQFLDISGEITAGSREVCRGQEVQLKVLSIGPVVSYNWYKENGLGWTKLTSNISTYTINSAQQADKGRYKVVVDNGSCILESIIAIEKVLEPGPRPIIEGSAVLCNESVRLRTVKNSNYRYQWYQDSLPIPGANDATYLTNVPANYSVVVSEQGACPFLPSNPHQLTLGTNNDCKAFADSVWFFGQNVNGSMTSPGVIFDNNGINDASRMSMVNSTGTNFATGVQICGAYGFYSSYDTSSGSGVMYNRKHIPMKDGFFNAPINSTDGYAGAYVGGNQYAFFAVSADDDLNYYLVDMNADGGNGALIFQKKVANNVTQGIELFPREGTSNQFWLIYYDKVAQALKVDLLTGSTLQNTSSYINPFNIAPSKVPIICKSSDANRFAALSYSGSNYLDIYEINRSTGWLSLLSQTELTTVKGQPFALSFSADGNYCAVASDPGKFQVVTVNGVSSREVIFTKGGDINAPLTTPLPSIVGGLKLGPDGVMYQKTNEHVYAINWQGGNLVSFYGTTLTGDNGENFSIGLTPPSYLPVDLRLTNQAPVAVPDNLTVYKGGTNKIYPTINDVDADGDAIFLTDVSFEDALHAVKGVLGIKPDLKEITFTPSATYVFSEDEEIVLKYEIRDSTVFNSICTSGRIVLKMSKTLQANDDQALIFACGVKEIDVLSNDDVLTGINLLVKQQGKLGNSSIVNNQLVYNHSDVNCQNKIGKDTVHYSLCLQGNCSDAVLIVSVLKNSNIQLKDSCSFEPKLVLDIQYQGIYQWQYALDGVSWSDVSCTGTACSAIIPGYYRVKLLYQGMETYSRIRKLVLEKETKLPLGLWYQMKLE